MKVSTVKGPWVSLGIHVDFQKRYIDLHILWWIITIGRDYYGPEVHVKPVPAWMSDPRFAERIAESLREYGDRLR